MRRAGEIWPLPGEHDMANSRGVYDRIYDVAALIPKGRVATYGQLADIAGKCTARMAGYAMAATPPFVDIPWQRVINSRGCVSPRRRGEGHDDQRRLLETEGVAFDPRGRIDLARFGWRGPSSAQIARLEREWKRKST